MTTNNHYIGKEAPLPSATRPRPTNTNVDAMHGTAADASSRQQDCAEWVYDQNEPGKKKKQGGKKTPGGTGTGTGTNTSGGGGGVDGSNNRPRRRNFLIRTVRRVSGWANRLGRLGGRLGGRRRRLLNAGE